MSILTGKGPLAMLSLIFRERRCVACSSVFLPGKTRPPSGFGSSFCPACSRRLERRQGGYCPLCGDPSENTDITDQACLKCLLRRPPWTNLLFHGIYEDLLKELIIKLKFGNSLILARHLGRLLAAHPELPGLAADIIIPIPLHSRRLLSRGFNQTLELARPMAGKLGIPLAPGTLIRQRATHPQRGLSKRDRRLNIANAFAPGSKVDGKHILLVDDVVTTGSTMEAATQVLLDQGARCVSVAALARAPLF